MRTEDKIIAAAFTIPVIAILLALTVYPVTYSIAASLQKVSLFNPQGGVFIGFGNYIALFRLSEFWQSLLNGVIFAGGTVSLQLLSGLGMALLLNQAFKGRAIARMLILSPYLLPSVVSAVVFRWTFNDLYGIANYVLVDLGLIRAPRAWFGSPDTAMLSVILVATWNLSPFVVVSLLARLRTIPPELYDAAKIDGAKAIDMFRYVTLPQLKDVLLIVVLLRSVWTFNNFETIWLLTGGGPVRSTQTLPIMSYLFAFARFDLGMGTATVVCLFLTVFLGALTYFKVSKI